MENCGKCRKRAILIIFGAMVQLTLFAPSAAYPLGSKLTPKRIASRKDMPDDDGYLDYQSGVRYDEYPIVVPKRAALILDRILKEIESAKDSNQLINDWSPKKYGVPEAPPAEQLSCNILLFTAPELCPPYGIKDRFVNRFQGVGTTKTNCTSDVTSMQFPATEENDEATYDPGTLFNHLKCLKI